MGVAATLSEISEWTLLECVVSICNQVPQKSNKRLLSYPALSREDTL